MSKVVVCWDQFVKAQNDLDQNIHNLKGLKVTDTIQERKLALLIELAELINESKCFKYWSSSCPNREKFLAEYVDVLHFSLSLSISYDLKLEKQDYYLVEKPTNQFLVNFFIDLWPNINNLLLKENFHKWMEVFLQIGSYFAFTFAEIEDSYFKKLNINYQRQQTNY